MSEQPQELPPRGQAMHDYRNGGALADCPKHYNDIQRFHYAMEMHRLQVDELNRMREAI